jgi:mannose-6-phosphate isomerase-like protein (cupin superfamily)
VNKFTWIRKNQSEAVPHDLSVNPKEKVAPHLHERMWDLFFVVSGSGEIRYKGKSGVNTVPMPASVPHHPAGLRARSLYLSATEPFSFLLIHTPWQG